MIFAQEMEVTMSINFHVTGKERKALVEALSEITFSEAAYAGAPTIHAEWQHRSRSESWTEEMRDTARQRALEQHRKEKK